MDDIDRRFMERALELALEGRGKVEPNPLVGAVVVQDGQIVGEGAHPHFGGPHAEVVALDRAGDRARGSTLYVSLEPCCHHGKTPPCTDRVIASGVRRVVAAMADPFPQVSGQGFEKLRQAGIDVETSCLESEARRLNLPYWTLLHEGRPFVHLKWAMSLDGRIATSTGDSKWITSPIAREHAHRFRATVDAILVGSGTAHADDPLLTPRLADDQSVARTPTRVILDSRCQLSKASQLVRTAREVPVLVATTNIARPADISRLAACGCECVVFRPTPEGRVPLPELLAMMGRRRWTHLLVEGGGETIGSFVDAGLVDALRVYVGGVVIGGRDALPAVGGEGFVALKDSPRFDLTPPISLGSDLFFEGVRLADRSAPNSAGAPASSLTNPKR